MLTFDDSRKDAAEASTSLRSLAHATRTRSDRADAHPVIGDLLASVRSLRQVLDQLANAHIADHARAQDDADSRLAGVSSALADALRRAGTLLDSVEWRLDAAAQHSARIAWQSEIPQRWVSVVFLQGAEADEVLDLLDRDGAHAAIEHLAGYDYGEDTVQAAPENGYVYDAPPTGMLDRTATRDVYTLVYSPFLGHLNLLREYDAVPDLDLLGIDTPAPEAKASQRATEHERQRDTADWFSGPTRSPQRGVGLSL